MTNKRRQVWSKKHSSNKPYKRALLREKSNTENTFLEGFVKRVLNNKAESNTNNILYGYYPKLIKDYGSDILSWIYNTPIDHWWSV